MDACSQCGESVDRRYRFCPWCAAPLRRKLVEFFRGHAAIDSGRAVRVSRYVDEGHVRVSVWDETGEALAAVSLDELEAARLGRFLAPVPPPRASLLEQLREAARR
ncbi:MAG: zinc ribbon domain-containing protein [Thermoleophilia bacterium]|nr:zinc ribbon domain-containing protein [Thermoleophilia bacterium]